MTRAAVAIVLSLGLSAASAAHAAGLACQPDTPKACCCPAPSAASPCQLSCVPDAPAAAVTTASIPIRLAAAWALGLTPLQASPLTRSGTSGPSRAAQPALHAPPRRRYLLACVLRL